MLRLLGLAGALALGGIGCKVTGVDMPFDEDQDGLLIEDTYGTDPNNPDTDGDTYLDGVEVDAGTDPLDANDHPYAMGWPIDSCRRDMSGSGNQVGQVAANFTGTAWFNDPKTGDARSEDVHLWDFCGHVVLVENAGFT